MSTFVSEKNTTRGGGRIRSEIMELGWEAWTGLESGWVFGTYEMYEKDNIEGMYEREQREG